MSEDDSTQVPRKISFVQFALAPTQVNVQPNVPRHPSAWVRCVHGASLLGYSMMLSGIMMAFVAALGFIEWTEGLALTKQQHPLKSRAIYNGIVVPSTLGWILFYSLNVAQARAFKRGGPEFARVSLVSSAVVYAVFLASLLVISDAMGGAGETKYYCLELLISWMFGFTHVLVDSMLRRKWQQRRTMVMPAHTKADAPQVFKEPAAQRREEEQQSDNGVDKKPLVYSIIPVVALFGILLLYPVNTIPVFFAGGSATRLVICLVVHPFVLTCAEVFGRASAAESVSLDLLCGNISQAQADDRVIQASARTFVVKQIMAFYRRFMLLNMGSAEATMAAIVGASIEEAISRGFLVEIDHFARRMMKRPLLRGQALRLQSLVWMCDTNLSSIAEFNAIITSTMAQVLLQPHAEVLALGYMPPSTHLGVASAVLDVPLAFVQVMTELTLELLVDNSAIWSESEHGIPVTEYFGRCKTLLTLPLQLAGSVSAFGIVLYSFIRHPMFLTCPSASVCGSPCATEPLFEGWVGFCEGARANESLRESAVLAGGGERLENATDRAAFAANVFEDIDLISVFVALASCVAMLAVIALSVLYARYRSHHQQFIDLSSSKISLAAKAAALSQSSETFEKKAHIAEAKVRELESNLWQAQLTVQKFMNEDSSIISAFKLNHDHLVLGEQLGMGSFGIVLRGTYRGKEVAVKTVRSTKVTDDTMSKFKSEIIIMAPLKHVNLVELVGGCWDSPDELCIVLELCERGALSCVLKTALPEHSWEDPYCDIMLGTARCLRFLHHEQHGQYTELHAFICAGSASVYSPLTIDLRFSAIPYKCLVSAYKRPCIDRFTYEEHCQERRGESSDVLRRTKKATLPRP